MDSDDELNRGPQGPEGPRGVDGDVGEAGHAGEPGHTGGRGPRGPAGPAGKSAAEAVTLLPGAFNRLTDALHHDARRRRWQALAFAVLFAVGIGGTFIQSANNGRVIGRVEDVLVILNNATGPDAQARQAAGTRDILTRNAIEVDCRFRRQHSGFAAPDPAQSCPAQTPPEVYPGSAQR